MTKYLFTGSRDWTDEAAVRLWFDHLAIGPDDLVVDGGARGLDSIAFKLAKEYGAQTRRFFADWKNHGYAAGPRRNRLMYDTIQPDYVLGFPLPQSKGTRDMLAYASLMHVRVLLDCTQYGPPVKASRKRVPKGQ
jgi:hypothetical protein